MKSLTYTDIINEKIIEWRSSLRKLEARVETAASRTKSELGTQVAQLKSEINKAIVQLRNLDEQETVANTIETKDKILNIFSSIDEKFKGNEANTPFML